MEEVLAVVLSSENVKEIEEGNEVKILTIQVLITIVQSEWIIESAIITVENKVRAVITIKSLIYEQAQD